MRFDFTKLTLGVDTMLPSITNPRHRAILLNYRRHAMLETSGRYEEIFSPRMTVEVPEYKVMSKAGTAVLRGADVVAMYKGLVDTRTTVMMLESERVAVSDWGLLSEALFHTFKPGRHLTEMHEGCDADAIYIESRWMCMAWPYDEHARMIGEHVYLAPNAVVRRCETEEIWSVEEVREVLAPLINEID